MFSNFEMYRDGWIDAEAKRKHTRSWKGCLPCETRSQSYPVINTDCLNIKKAGSGRRNVTKNDPYARDVQNPVALSVTTRRLARRLQLRRHRKLVRL
jgi:hypothetical protein